MSTFSAIASLVVIFALEYVLILLLFYVHELRKKLYGYDGDNATAVEKFRISTSNFACCYLSIYGEQYNDTLLATRSVTLLYFLSVNVILQLIVSHHSWNYFTVWNLWLITAYFILAVASSLLGRLRRAEVDAAVSRVEDRLQEQELARARAEAQAQTVKREDEARAAAAAAENGDAVTRNASVYVSLSSSQDMTADAVVEEAATGAVVEEDVWGAYLPVLSQYVHVLYSTAGATALFVTLVNFVLLSPIPHFWNVSQHLVTSVVLLAEMAQVSMVVRWETYVYPLTWAFMFAVFTWVVVGSGEKRWPYTFMKAGSLWSIVWYNGILLVSVLTYAAWVGLDRWKRGQGCCGNRCRRCSCCSWADCCGANGLTVGTGGSAANSGGGDAAGGTGSRSVSDSGDGSASPSTNRLSAPSAVPASGSNSGASPAGSSRARLTSADEKSWDSSSASVVVVGGGEVATSL